MLLTLFWGIQSYQPVAVPTPIEFAGIAAQLGEEAGGTQTYTVTGSGQLLFGDAASFLWHQITAGSGALQFGGVTAPAAGRVITSASGQVLFVGAAGVETHEASRTVVGAGGWIFDGDAVIASAFSGTTTELVVLGSGQLLFGSAGPIVANYNYIHQVALTPIRLRGSAQFVPNPVFVGAGGFVLRGYAAIDAELLEYWQVPAGASVSACLSANAPATGQRSFS